MRRSTSSLLTGLVVLGLVITGCSSGGDTAEPAVTTNVPTTTRPAPDVTMPEVTGPIGGPGEPWSAVTAVPEDADYTTSEYFISGTATSYEADDELTEDGRWSAKPDTDADYETRILVHRPSDPEQFNGTVVLEWLNVSAGFDTAPDFLFTQRELLRDGYAWVGVSAQKAGITPSGDGVLGIEPLKGMNPERYESLHHPGDEYSYDIFSQASAAVRAAGDDQVLGGLDAKRVIADGESQSAFRMVDYIDAVQPVTHAFDGFLVHSRWAQGTPLNPTQTSPEATVLRTDLSVPILQVQSETDVGKYLLARQPDTDLIRTWEIPGTAHVDSNVLAGFLGCATPVNSGPQIYVMGAALSALNTWIQNRSDPPREASRIEIDGDGLIARDGNGNAVGGIRTPQLEVPVATLSGEGGQGSGFCSIAGVTEPFSAARATKMYGSKDAYLEKFDATMQKVIDKGFLLEADADAMRDEAAGTWPGS